MSPRDTGSESRSVLGRALQVLAVFGPEAQELTLSELAQRAGLPKTTTHRIVTTLASWGALEHADGRFRVGMRLFELGELVVYRRLRELAIPYMQDLYEASHHVVQLAVLDGDDVVYIEKIGGHRQVPALSRVGGRIDAHRTAVGKALLAFSPRRTLDHLIERRARIADGTPIDAGALRSEIDLVAMHRIAYDRGGVVPGITCVATPLFGRDRWAVASLSVMGGGDLDVEQTTLQVRSAGQQVSKRLSQSNWP